MKQTFVFEKQVEVAGVLKGLITVPRDFDPKTEALPLIVFLHGAGERGDDVERVRVHGIPKLFGSDPDYHGLRVITASPQCPAGMTWNHLAFPLMDWIRAVAREYNADESRISICGLSMGGFGTWEMLCTFPDVFCCGAPVCGGGLSWRCSLLRGQKIRAYHSVDDDAVPFSYSEQMVTGAKANGADIKFFPVDGYGHFSWIYAFEETDLIEWLAAGGCLEA
ncbi:MAG: phospholipase [Clostridia bacterium]|nr:phospholipase [Clostridia bacterium]